MPTENVVLYWSGLSRNRLVEFEDCKEKINALLMGQTNSSDLDLKKAKGYRLYTIRLNQADRLLFTSIIREGKSYILLLEKIANHDYQKSRFLKRGVLHHYLEGHAEALEVVDAGSFEEATKEGLGHLESEPKYEAARYFNGQYILLNAEQISAVEHSFPMMVSGPPGSGKSCVALELMKKHVWRSAEGDARPIVCIVPSEALAGHLESQWRALSELSDVDEAVLERVVFCTYEQMLQRVFGVLGRVVNKSHFNEWLAAYQSSSPVKAKKQRNMLSDTEKVYQEFCIMVSCDKTLYLSLGKRQSLFDTEEERLALWDAYQTYRERLFANNLIFPAFYNFQIEQPLFSGVVVDEAQDFTLHQLTQLGKLSDFQIGYCLDSHQSLIASKSIRPALLRQLPNLTHVMLQGTYRCPREVAAFANRVLEMKNHVTGGISDKEECPLINLELNTRRGSVEWVSDFRDILGQIQELRLRFQLKGTELAVVAPDAFIEEAKEKTGLALVFSPSQIKGLEYRCVIAYRPLDAEGMREANRCLPSGTEELKVSVHRSKGVDVEQEAFGPLFNRIFVTFTRSIEALVVWQAEAHEKQRLITHLKQALPQVVCGQPAPLERVKVVPETTRVDWHNEVMRLYWNGNKEQAEALYNAHLADLEKCSFEGYLEKSVPMIMTKLITSSSATASSYQGQSTKKDSQTDPNRADKKSSTKPKAGVKLPECLKGIDSSNMSISFQNLLPQLFKEQNWSFWLYQYQLDDKKTLFDHILSDKKKMISFNLALSALNAAESLRVMSALLDIKEAGVSVYLQRLIVALYQMKLKLINPFVGIVHLINEQSLNAEIIHKDLSKGYSLLFFIFLEDELIKKVDLSLIKKISKEGLNRKVDGGQDHGISPFFLLCSELEGMQLLSNYWKDLKGKITSEGLHQVVIRTGSKQGISPFWLLCSYKERRQFLLEHWGDLKGKITLEGLHQVVPTEGYYKEISPFWFLCATPEGQQLLLKYWDDLKDKITHVHLHQAVVATGPHKGISPFGLLCEKSGGQQLLLKHWGDLKGKITVKGLHQVAPVESVNKGKSPFWFLCATPEGQQFLLDHWKDLKDKITSEGLHQVVPAEGADKGKSPFLLLCSGREGVQLLSKYWDDLKDKITVDGLHQVVIREGSNQGISPFWLLCSTPEGCQLLLEHWEDFKDKITEVGLHQAVIGKGINEGISPFWLLCLTPKGCQFLLEHWEDFKDKITEVGLHQAVIGKGINEGVSPFWLLCNSVQGCELLFAHWKNFKDKITAEGLEQVVSAEGFEQGKSALWLLCSSPDGRQLLITHWEDFKDKITVEGLNQAVTAEGPFQGTSLFWCLCFTSEGRDFVFTHWDDLKSKITSKGLNQVCTGEGPCKGMSAFWFLSSARPAEWFQLVMDDWIFLKDKITKEGLHQAVTAECAQQGKSAFGYFCFVPEGKKLFTAHREYFKDKITTEGLHQVITSEGLDQGKSVFWSLCSSSEGLQFLRDHWGDFKDKITSEGLNHACTGEGCDKGKSAFWVLCETPEGLQFLIDHWDDVKNKMTSKGLKQVCTGEGPNKGKSPYTFLEETPEGKVLIKKILAHHAEVSVSSLEGGFFTPSGGSSSGSRAFVLSG